MKSIRRLARSAAVLGGVTAVGGAATYGFLDRRHQKNSIPPSTAYNKSYVPPRTQMVNRMKDEVFDVLVIGGGATGAGVAVDAAARGLKCALVEGDDFASGTSSRSTKLIHGGVRYLESAVKNFDLEPFKLVVEALEERAHLMNAAPHMSHAMPIVMPVYNSFELFYFWIGVKVYDWLAKAVCVGQTGLPDSFRASASNAKFFFPYLKEKGLKGSLIYYDGMHNDARTNLALIQTACSDNWVDGFQGAAVGNHLEVQSMLFDADKKVSGVVVKDTVTGDSFKIRAKAIVNCTGPFADSIRKMADPDVESLITPAAGVHIVLPSFYASNDIGMIVPETSDGRVLFALPWEGSVVVGTTDGKSELSREPRATEDEVGFIIREAAKYWSVTEEEIRRDMKAAWTGLRPLVKDVSKRHALKPMVAEADKSAGGVATGLADEKEDGTASLSRTHQIVVDESGMISVLGGKWTTYRQMAQDAIGAVLDVHGEKFKDMNGDRKSDFDKCRTKNMRLVGSVSFESDVVSRDLHTRDGFAPRILHEKFPQLPFDVAAHLVKSYGAEAFELCREAKPTDLVPLVPGHSFVRAEVDWAIKHEMACTVADVLARRMRLAFVDAQAASSVADFVAQRLGEHLLWDKKRVQAEAEKGKNFIKTLKL